MKSIFLSLVLFLGFLTVSTDDDAKKWKQTSKQKKVYRRHGIFLDKIEAARKKDFCKKVKQYCAPGGWEKSLKKGTSKDHYNFKKKMAITYKKEMCKKNNMFCKFK